MFQSMQANYNYEKYDKNWKRPNGDYFQLLVGFLTNNLAKYSNSSILEIGFGSARLASILKSIGFTGKYIGLDVQNGAIDFARKLKLPEPEFKFFLVDDLKTHGLELDRQIDLAIFCLSLCEMKEETVNKYINFLKDNKVNKILVINPSSQTQMFPSIIYKSFLSKITSRLGGKATWLIKSKFVQEEECFPAIINGKEDKAAMQISRSLGKTIQLFLDKGFKLEKYEDIKFPNQTKNHPKISRFEALWFKV